MNKEDKKRLIIIRHSMYCRCYYPSTHGYQRYGARGIKVCDEWIKNPQSFYDWAMENGYKKDLTLDRIDVNGNYEPSNCRWITRKEQMSNTRTNRNITYKGETKTLTQWCEEYNINIVTFSDRIKSGMSVDEALNKPVVKGGGKIFYTLNGERKMLSEWCEIYHIRYQTAWRKHKKGCSVEQILNLENSKNK